MFEIKSPSLAKWSDIILDAMETVFKEVATDTGRKDFFAPGELVNIITRSDEHVCAACEDLAEGGPYTIDEARKQIPHHPGCRCVVVPMSARTDRPGMLEKRIGKHFSQVRRITHQFTRGVMAGQRYGGEIISPQRNAMIVRRMKASGRSSKKFIAPSGSRTVRYQRRKR